MIGAVRLSGGAAIGSIVRVADRNGRISEYELVSRPDATAPEPVPLASSVGQALSGALPGDDIQITLGNGRRRRVRVLDVESQ